MTAKLQQRFAAVAIVVIVIVLALCFSAGCSPSVPAANAANNAGHPAVPTNPSASPGDSGQTGAQDQSDPPPATEPSSTGASGSQASAGSSAPGQGVPDSPTAFRMFYDGEGNPPQAPGLNMKARRFASERSKTVYLSIDDGPYPETTPRLLEILRDKGVSATFFVIGRQVERYPELLKAEYEQGHGIGNHSYSHNYATVYQSPESFLQEIKQNEDIIFKTIGVRPRMIRAPGGTQGHFNIAYYNAVDADDYLVYDWNVSTGDAAAPLVSASQLVENVKKQIAGKERAIILMHDTGTKKTTVAALPQIIDYLRDQGYRFAVLSPEVTPILFTGGFRP
ncbi:polysaccharide deacetylase family protein [Paradesulfitobacterium aromaticivorans]